MVGTRCRRGWSGGSRHHLSAVSREAETISVGFLHGGRRNFSRSLFSAHGRVLGDRHHWRLQEPARQLDRLALRRLSCATCCLDAGEHLRSECQCARQRDSRLGRLSFGDRCSLPCTRRTCIHRHCDRRKGRLAFARRFNPQCLERNLLARGCSDSTQGRSLGRK
ncbi:hypothetical protein D3C86_1724300 [compost metagenome]